MRWVVKEKSGSAYLASLAAGIGQQRACETDLWMNMVDFTIGFPLTCRMCEQ